ncbi:hypothetical protein B9Z51_08125 [Limnohabitans sp. T6-5]|uniref:DUF802 domain-containing protein n=1 Tax=Limnohabitans sp. T6-5 TaxID=1100724 RepID=UPI000D352316|nr:DUF802 domain-containing protein [Limnohabitans sp. T6-5]PUE08894.1 hypothetical protein B9Z51_08125 [Limnohabitans sp. T6-5]
MKRYSFETAFGLGALAVLWVAASVASSHLLVLVMTAFIGGVYVFGALELRQYRATSAALRQALTDIPQDLITLNDWLITLPAALHNPVRQRIEGERVGLPGPALTPYLVGLLVMLGMLGTFLGMVVTLNGAVFALEGSSNLAGIRAAFSEPIKGLGLAFGTSVAGVATSAMLGLMSSLARRERAQASQFLDTQIATRLRGFSLTHQRQETFKALQQQTQALPQVVQQLQAMMVQMAKTSEHINERLLANQQSFHQEVHTAYTGLAQSVDQSLRTSLSHSMQVASDGIRPVVQATMAQLSEQAQSMNERLLLSTQAQMSALNDQFSATAAQVAQSYTTALAQNDAANTGLIERVGQTLDAFSQTFEQRAQDLVATIHTTSTQQLAQQSSADQQRLESWTTSLEGMATALSQQWQASGTQTLAQQQAICDTLTQTAQDITQQVQAHASQTLADLTRQQDHQTTADQQRLEAWQASLQATAASLQNQWQTAGDQTLAQQEQICNTLTQTASLVTEQVQAHTRQTLADLQRVQSEQASSDQQRLQAWQDCLQATASALQSQWQQSGDQTLAQQQQICDTLTQTAQDITTHTQTQATQTLAEITRLMASSEALMQARIASEAQWADQNAQRANELSDVLRTELSALRDAEEERGQAAVARLAELQTAVTAHLSTLGTALEDPITRLIETASEAPKAAAEVIGQLRQEISVSVARDNTLLEERTRIMATLSSLLDAIHHASTEQRGVIDSLVSSSAVTLEQANSQFVAHVSSESAKLGDIAAQVTASAVDVASLGETFSFAVRAFNEANEKLMSQLQRIEQAMDKSMTRSDEQLAYYVAQARDIIDLSITSQKDVLETLQHHASLATEGAA